MHIEQKVNIHNRFDVEVRDAKTGELKQKATGFNIVLDQMWTRLCGGSSYFVNIHFGTGGGTLSPSRTSLFTHLGTKTAADEEQVKALPVSRWKRKIVLNPEEFVGSTITEVGIAFGSTASNLVTHALLKDAEGNPISITKTDLDVVTIYATVFVTINNAAGITMLGMPASNQLVNYLVGGAAAPTGSFGLLPTMDAFSRLGSTATVTWTSDVPNKKRKTNTARFDINTGNGHVKVLEFTNLFAVEFPATSIFTGQPYVGVAVGTGNDVNKIFNIPSNNIEQSTLNVKANGVVVNDYTKKEILNGEVKIQNPSSLPASHSRDLAMTPDGLIKAIAHSISPFISVYDWNGFNWTKRSNSINLTINSTWSVALSSDGLTMALGYDQAPWVSTYDWNGSAWTERPSPAIPPTGTVHGISLTPDGLVMAVAHDTSPFVSTYDWNGSAWIKRPNPVNLPGGHARAAVLTPDGLLMGVAHYTSPFVTTYDWNGSAWIKRPNPPSLPSECHSVSFTPNGLIMAVAHALSPFVSTYDWNGSAWIKRSNPDILPVATGKSVAISTDGQYMIVGHETSPFISTYDWNGSAWIKRPNPANLPGGTVVGISITSDNTKFSLAHEQTPFLATYKNSPMTQLKFNTPPNLGVVITADYTVRGVHKTNQYVNDASFAIAFGEGA